MKRQIPVFSSAQTKELRGIGLHVEQIDELQKQLMQIKMYLEPSATVSDIRARWNSIGKPLAAARRELAMLMDSKQADGAESKYRLLDAVEDADLLENAAKAIDAVKVAIAAASAKLPSQRRHHTASSLPIGIIDRALLRGFIKHYPAPMPPYMLSASRSGDFAKVVSVCFQAVGRDLDPDRAIRNFVSKESLRTSLSRMRLFSPLFGSQLDLSADLLSTRKPGRPRGSKRK